MRSPEPGGTQKPRLSFSQETLDSCLRRNGQNTINTGIIIKGIYIDAFEAISAPLYTSYDLIFNLFRHSPLKILSFQSRTTGFTPWVGQIFRLLKNAHLQPSLHPCRCSVHSSAPLADSPTRRRGMKSLLIRCDTTLRISGALHRGIFDQPEKNEIFNTLLF